MHLVLESCYIYTSDKSSDIMSSLDRCLAITSFFVTNWRLGTDTHNTLYRWLLWRKGCVEKWEKKWRDVLRESCSQSCSWNWLKMHNEELTFFLFLYSLCIWPLSLNSHASSFFQQQITISLHIHTLKNKYCWGTAHKRLVFVTSLTVCFPSFPSSPFSLLI